MIGLPMDDGRQIITSGGASGVDTYVEQCCLATHRSCRVLLPPCHPRAKYLAPLSPAEMDEGRETIQLAAIDLNRSFSSPITLQYLTRNYHVVKDATLVLVLSFFDNKGGVVGGSAWAMAMAIRLNKPLYFFDGVSGAWFYWQHGAFVACQSSAMSDDLIAPPTLESDHVAIAGTREPNDLIVQALNTLFKL